MEENSENKLPNESGFEDFKDFKDFEESDTFTPELEAEEVNEQTEENDLLKDALAIQQMAKEIDIAFSDSPDETEANSQIEENIEEKEANNKDEGTIPPPIEQNHWEETDDDNGIMKKYIFYVSKDFIPLIDSLTTDERTAYINDAIQRKIDAEYEKSASDKKKKILTHIVLMILTFFIFMPIALFIVHKSIMVTFSNYKYSQDNFEKLYKERLKNDKTYTNTTKYNKNIQNKTK